MTGSGDRRLEVDEVIDSMVDALIKQGVEGAEASRIAHIVLTHIHAGRRVQIKLESRPRRTGERLRGLVPLLPLLAAFAATVPVAITLSTSGFGGAGLLILGALVGLVPIILARSRAMHTNVAAAQAADLKRHRFSVEAIDDDRDVSTFAAAASRVADKRPHAIG